MSALTLLATHDPASDDRGADEPLAREAAAMSPEPYVHVSYLRVPAERARDLVAAFRPPSEWSTRPDGLIALEARRTRHDAGLIVLVSRWRHREAFQACAERHPGAAARAA